MNKVSFLILAVLLLFSDMEALAQNAPPAIQRDITRVAGDLYRARNGGWYTVFLVTEDGIIMGDPINNEFAAWLKDELDARYDVPVRYVVYSHSHFDHAPGGSVFQDTAEFVGHINMERNLDGRYPHMPGDMIDRNNNGLIDFEEIMIPTESRPGVCGWSSGFFALFGEGPEQRAITPQQLMRNIVPPTIYYTDRMSIRLGGKTVELIFPGLNHADDTTVMFFPEERAIFAVDFLADALVRDNMHSLPSACGPFDGNPLSEWIKSYRTVEALDFDILVPGHGILFSKSDVTATREYFEDLKAAVEGALSAGLSLDEMKQVITLDKYRVWANYERLLEYNIEAAYFNLTQYRY